MIRISVFNKLLNYAAQMKHIGAVPNSMEKFMTFKIGDVKLIDSFQFMASSFEILSNILSTQSTDKNEMPENMKNILTPMS